MASDAPVSVVRLHVTAVTHASVRARAAVLIDDPIPCSAAEHFTTAADPQFCALRRREDGQCSVCATTRRHEVHLCERCRRRCCSSCRHSNVLYQLIAADRATLLAPAPTLTRPTAGEWPTVDAQGRVFAWFCWTGDNALPEYLQLCIDTFARRAASSYCVRLVRASDVEEVLGGPPHPAYQSLSLVHKSDYLRCELLHRHGGLYCDVDTICWSDLHSALHVELGTEGCAAVTADANILFECGLNVGLFRRGSYLTRCWRRALHARLDARLPALRAFRDENDDPREDGLEWNEVLRDIVVPLVAALNRLHPGHVAMRLRAHHWHHADQPQGYDPLALAAGSARAGGAPPEGTDVVVLNNNQYSKRVKAATRDQFLSGDSALAQMVSVALG